MIKKLSSLIRILERCTFFLLKSQTHTIRPTIIIKDVSIGRNHWREIMCKIR